MSNRATTLALAALVVFSGLLMLVAFRKSEPSYKDKPLSAWLRELNKVPSLSRNEAAEAVKQMGANAIPLLVEILREKDSHLKQELMKLANRQSLVKFVVQSAEDRHWLAVAAFKEMGVAAKSAVPDLTPVLLKGENPAHAANALAYLGPEALPPLIEALTNDRPYVRTSAANALGFMRDKAERAVPALTRALDDSDPQVFAFAAQALAQIGSDEAIHGLMHGLTNTNSMVRAWSMTSLGELGSRASLAIPALLKIAQDEQSRERDSALETIKKISPDAAAKALHR